MEKLPLIQFTFDRWRAGSITELAHYARYGCIVNNKIKIRAYAVGWNYADNLYVRPKKNCFAVMYYTGCYWWSHLAYDEFSECFPEIVKST